MMFRMEKPELIVEQVNNIIDEFLETKSPHEINISRKIVSLVKNEFEMQKQNGQVTVDLFDGIVADLCSNSLYDSYMRFEQSEAFATLKYKEAKRLKSNKSTRIFSLNESQQPIQTPTTPIEIKVSGHKKEKSGGGGGGKTPTSFDFSSITEQEIVKPTR